ncbi:MAG: Rne/Rng family ribonuclease [Verrucomicrobiota bacterium]
MILKKIQNFLGFNKASGKEIVINVEPLERRVAVLENKVLEDFSIERDSDRSISGNIYKGRVHNIEPALKALFVDLNLEKNAFLHYWDAMPAALDSGVEKVERAGHKSRRKKITPDDIPNLYPPGSDIIVQVTKGPIGQKGARITTNISLAGRYLVLMPFSDQSGISRKINDPNERQRLRKILSNLTIPDGMAVIIRTVGEGAKTRYFVRDLALLIEQWREIEERLKTEKAPSLLLAEPGIIGRTVRDFLTADVDRITVDDIDTAERIKKNISRISKRSEKKVHLYSGAVPLFESLQINRQIDNAFRRIVWLKSGAYIVIDETEALVAIDVNTGRNKSSTNHDNTILNTNMEAAEEISRQLRLRNIGGLIVIDFIDMKHRKDQHAVVNYLKDFVRKDRAKTHVLPISQLGLVEMTRQRLQESISQSVYMECPSCKGKGMVKTPETISVELQRDIGRVFSKNKDIHELRILVHPEIMNRLRKEDQELLVDLERKYESRLAFRTDNKVFIEEYKIINGHTEEEIDISHA